MCKLKPEGELGNRGPDPGLASEYEWRRQTPSLSASKDDIDPVWTRPEVLFGDGGGHRSKARQGKVARPGRRRRHLRAVYKHVRFASRGREKQHMGSWSRRRRYDPGDLNRRSTPGELIDASGAFADHWAGWLSVESRLEPGGRLRGERRLADIVAGRQDQHRRSDDCDQHCDSAACRGDQGSALQALRSIGADGRRRMHQYGVSPAEPEHDKQWRSALPTCRPGGPASQFLQR